MMRTTFTRGGWLRCRELTALAKPLAVLLVLLFSLIIHINSALAAGGDSSICAATRAMSNADINTPSQQLQLEHCGICIVSIEYKSFGLQHHAATIEIETENNLVSFVSEVPGTANIAEYSQIRAPPFS